MNRQKKREYKWVFKDSFVTTGYQLECEDGTYIVWAKDMPNAEWLYVNKLNTKSYLRDCEDRFENRLCIKPYFKNNGTEAIYKRPFWYYGRIYKLS